MLYRIMALVGQERKEGRHRRNKSILLFENSTMKLNTVHANKMLNKKKIKPTLN